MSKCFENTPPSPLWALKIFITIKFFIDTETLTHVGKQPNKHMDTHKHTHTPHIHTHTHAYTYTQSDRDTNTDRQR